MATPGCRDTWEYNPYMCSHVYSQNGGILLLKKKREDTVMNKSAVLTTMTHRSEQEPGEKKGVKTSQRRTVQMMWKGPYPRLVLSLSPLKPSVPQKSFLCTESPILSAKRMSLQIIQKPLCHLEGSVISLLLHCLVRPIHHESAGFPVNVPQELRGAQRRGTDN